MFVKFDLPATQCLLYRTETRQYGDRRRYYAANRPHRLLLVLRHGLDISDLQGQVVSVAVGWDVGWIGFVRAGNERRRHTKVTAFALARGEQPAGTLSDILIRSPKDNQA